MRQPSYKAIIVGIVATVSFSQALFAQATPGTLSPEQRQVVASVETLFRAVSKDDTRLFDSVIEPKFYLFDAGKRFDGNSILSLIEKAQASGKRYAWNVTEPDVHMEGSTAWIAYVNRGSVTDASGVTKREWLESAFLTKEAGGWKLAFMQSTPVPSAPPQH
jgi:hypothetical protein